MTKTVIIDAGHGGTDPGAQDFGFNEKTWTLKMSAYQYKRLKALGVEVSMTRMTDKTLEPFQRVARIKNQYDLCLSNHFNAFNGKARGVEGIRSIHSQSGLAKDLVDRVVKKTGLPKRRVFQREIKKGVDYYYMHRLTGKTETIILEYGFIDSRLDVNYYKEEAHFYKAAEAVIEGICVATGHQYRLPGSSSVTHVEKEKRPKKAGETFGKSKQLVSHYPGKLRFYKKPSWQDADVYGYLTMGQRFPKVIKKLTVGRGKQYQVENSKGETYYVTASPIYVSLK